MQNKVYEVAIVGAGAAGLMAAVECRRKGLEVLLLDSQKKIGAKILMSGGTRCNVTNKKVTEKDFASDHIRMARNILRAFPSEKTIQFFEELGVELILEEGGKFFPSTHSGRTLLEAFLNELDKRNIPLETERKIRKVSFENDQFTLYSQNQKFFARNIVLCTGGLSYPTSGSDGGGYQIAKFFGHDIVKTIPALTPILIEDQSLKSLSGVSLPCRLSLFYAGKKQISFKGPILFTHFGISGPSALNMSRYWVRAKEYADTQLLVSFLPSENPDSLREKIALKTQEAPESTVKRFLKEWVPERFCEVILSQSGIEDSLTLGQFSREKKHLFSQALLEYPIKVRDVFGYTKAEVTAGGIRLDEVDYRTLESKHRSGLFFAGEVLDADGRIGGFNFQWAWATGAIAAQGVYKRMRLKSQTK